MRKGFKKLYLIMKADYKHLFLALLFRNTLRLVLTSSGFHGNRSAPQKRPLNFSVCKLFQKLSQ